MDGNKHDVPRAPKDLEQGIPSSITYDFYSFYTSLDKIKSVVSRYEPGFVIPGHETSLLLKGI